MIVKVFIFILRGYQLFVSPVLTALSNGCGCCRFSPSCSEYAIQALRQHGIFRGGWLSIKRILKCHPWGGMGFDPVPAAEASRHH